MSVRPQSILWPTDFSDLSLKAGQYAKDLRDLFDCQFHVLHVCPELSVPAVMVEEGGGRSVSGEGVVEAAKKKLDNLVSKQFGKKSAATQEVVTGTPWYSICAYAEEEEIELIIMGTHGTTGLSHVFVGSTAERVVQHARCPVLVVKSIERDFVTK